MKHLYTGLIHWQNKKKKVSHPDQSKSPEGTEHPVVSNVDKTSATQKHRLCISRCIQCERFHHTKKKRVTEHIDKSHKSSQSPPGKLQNKVKPQLPIAKIASVWTWEEDAFLGANSKPWECWERESVSAAHFFLSFSFFFLLNPPQK